MGSMLGGSNVRNRHTNAATAKLASGSPGKVKPLGMSGGGLTSSISGGRLSIGSSAARNTLVSNISGLFGTQAGQIANLRKLVKPGASQLRKTRLQQIENARRSSIGNLRDNLARRRVLGSSFGEDAVIRGEKEFAQQSERVAAESFLQELDLTHQLIGEEFELRRNAFSTKLGELNLQADLASNLVAGANQVMTASAQLRSQLAISNAQLNAQLGIAQAEQDAAAAAGVGQLVGTGVGIALAPATGGASLALAGGGGKGGLFALS